MYLDYCIIVYLPVQWKAVCGCVSRVKVEMYSNLSILDI